jgi:hypothetical protein
MSLLQLWLISQVPVIILQTVITLDLRAPWNFAACAGILFICWTCIQHCATSKTDLIHYDYSVGGGIGVSVMDVIHMTLLVQPLHDFRHEKQTQPAHKLPWLQKFMWVTELCGSPRGIGWNFRVSFSRSTG